MLQIFQLHEIADVSIRNPRSPELRGIMKEGEWGAGKKFLLPSNQNLFFANLIRRSRYKYLIRISGAFLNQPFSEDTQFVDIEFQGGWKILIAFDDAENFVSVLKRRIS